MQDQISKNSNNCFFYFGLISLSDFEKLGLHLGALLAVSPLNFVLSMVSV